MPAKLYLLTPYLACFLAAFTALAAVWGQNVRAGGAAELTAEAPAPADNPSTAEKVALGKQLFFDPRLSGNNQMNCATCHVPEKGFSDGLPKGRGAQGKELPRNTQSVLNIGFYETYFWDGRAATLEEQALMPILAAEEMNQDLDQLEAELHAVPEYAAQFRSVFGTPVTRDGIAKALAAFQRTLVTRNSPFDRFLAGDDAALSQDAREGWEIFHSAGCARCHSGPNFSDSKFHRLGVSLHDKGRGAITGDSNDFYAFRTPGLRNIADTAPYMHDGSQRTLGEVVEFYYRSTAPGAGSLPLSFEPLNSRSFSEIPLIVAFLESLSGELPAITAQPH
jgi:cytochrome c peroxidase